MRSFIEKLRQVDQNFSQTQLSNITLICLAAIICCFWLLNPINIQLRMPDSTSYLRFDNYRGAGYPLFLHILQSLGVTLENIPVIQTTLFYCCLSYLCLRFKNCYQTYLFAIALMIGVGLNPAIIRYCFTLVTESLYFSSLLILLGALLSKQQKLNNSLLFFTGVCFAWLILIKPVSWAFICIPVLLIWQAVIQKNKALIKTSLFILGFLIIFSAGSVYRYTIHQQWFAGSFMGNQLIGKLAFSKFEPSRTPYPEASEHWLKLMQPIHQARDKFLTKDYQRFLFALNMYDYLRFTKMPEIIELMDIEQSKEGEALKELAFSIIKQSPQAYAYDIYLNFYSLWSIGELQNYQNSISYNKKINALIDKLNKDIPKPYILNEDNSMAPIIIKPFVALAFMLNISIIIYCLFTYIVRLKAIPEQLNVLFILCCSVQAYFLLTSLLQAALTRYALISWPFHLIVILASLLFLIGNKKTIE